jgi:hypothetical protein
MWCYSGNLQSGLTFVLELVVLLEDVTKIVCRCALIYVITISLRELNWDSAAAEIRSRLRLYFSRYAYTFRIMRVNFIASKCRLSYHCPTPHDLNQLNSTITPRKRRNWTVPALTNCWQYQPQFLEDANSPSNTNGIPAAVAL